MRLWSASVAGDTPLIIAAVHHEQGFLQHRIDRDWEVAEQRVRSGLCSVAAYDCEQGALIASQLAIQGGAERWRGWANDGRPALIRRVNDVGLER